MCVEMTESSMLNTFFISVSFYIVEFSSIPYKIVIPVTALLLWLIVISPTILLFPLPKKTINCVLHHITLHSSIPINLLFNEAVIKCKWTSRQIQWYKSVSGILLCLENEIAANIALQNLEIIVCKYIDIHIFSTTFYFTQILLNIL